MLTCFKLYTHTHRDGEREGVTHTHTERDRERERVTHTHTHTCDTRVYEPQVIQESLTPLEFPSCLLT